MKNRLYVDISSYSYSEFVDFVFDRVALPETDPPLSAEERSRRWYFSTQTTFDLPKLCHHYTRLFIESARLLDRFTKAQLELGFSAIQRGSTFSIKRLIWNTDLSFQNREGCVRSMFYLFKDFFSVEPLRVTANMWWDGLCYDWEIGRRRRSRGGEDLTMQDVMFETMFEILSIDSEECCNAALHGLSHLHHPATLELIQQYRSKIPSLKNWCDEYSNFESMWKERLEKRRIPWRSQAFGSCLASGSRKSATSLHSCPTTPAMSKLAKHSHWPSKGIEITMNKR